MNYHDLSKRRPRRSEVSKHSKAVLAGAAITGACGILVAITGPLHFGADSGKQNTAAGSRSRESPEVVVPASPAVQGYAMSYQNMELGIQASCGEGEYVNIDAPSVDPRGLSAGDSFVFDAPDCTGKVYNVELASHAAGGSIGGQDSPTGCINAIAADPIPVWSSVSVGSSFCVESSTGLVAYVKVASLNSPGGVILQLTGWKPVG